MKTLIVAIESIQLTDIEKTSIRHSYSDCTGEGAEIVALQGGQYVGLFNGKIIKEYLVNE